ncbi:MAG TPA: hypothetical protein VIT90_06335 [Lysobacter sp.]
MRHVTEKITPIPRLSTAQGPGTIGGMPAAAMAAAGTDGSLPLCRSERVVRSRHHIAIALIADRRDVNRVAERVG